MKKASYCLLLITFVFAAFSGGFFLGRNMNHGALSISTVKTATETTGTVPTGADPTTPTEAAKVDINTASVEDLSALPGIGPVLAQRIVDYRTEHGPFQKPADLCNVSGIGAKRLQDLLEYITVGGSS